MRPPDGPPSAPVPSPAGNLLGLERRVLAFWSREDTARRALTLHPEGPPFRFTEGPPTANGRPHIGHLLPRVLKDMGLRHRRMKGFRTLSLMAGWDCHGLPVEVEVEKAHGWTSKKQIVEFGVGPFSEECRTSVRTYVQAWQDFSERLAFWLDYDHPYETMDPRYIESVWWSLQQLFQKGLLEKGHYVVPYCPRCETPLAAHEVAQGYRETTDPSVTVRLRLEGPTDAFLLVWTTTPWTLPANLAVAVGEEIDYVVFRGEDGAEYCLAEAALPRYFPQVAQRPAVVRRLQGKELIGHRYQPPFPGLAPAAPERFQVYAGNFVTTTEGTGLVHVAPSFGVDDYQLGHDRGLGVFDPLDPSGRFTAEVPSVQGRWFKDADRLLMEELTERKVLWHRGSVKHTYPFCWRCDRPLMYRALDSWFVRTHKLREQLLANNATVTWDPAHLRDGRFGNFLAEGKDWALSRERFWGTPLPLWACPSGHFVAVGSFAELAKLSKGPLPEPFDPHRIVVDRLELSCPEHHDTMRREPYTIDAWYDSGSAPFAQYHYPFEHDPRFDPASPLDYVSEGIDQTRGWFYSLLVISTGLFARTAYRHVLCHGLGLDDAGKKMSKSKGNAVDPMALMDRTGADAARLSIYLADYTESFRFGEQSIRQSGLRMLTTLLNVLEFYRTNQESDRVPPARVAPRPTLPMDRWLLSRLERTVSEVDASLTDLDAHLAARSLEHFVQELSTWWLRRSRPRFWSESDSPEKRSAYDTLSFTLLTLAGAIAPLAPFTAEDLFQVVGGTNYAPGATSVHLQPFPVLSGARAPELEGAMARAQAWVEALRRLRSEAGVKSRMPLEEALLAGVDSKEVAPLGDALVPLLSEELNVKRVTILRPDEFLSRPFPSEEWIVAPEAPGEPRFALSRRPSPALRLEGLAREVVRRVQMTRKESRLRPSDHIHLELWLDGELREALGSHQAWVAQECLAADVQVHAGPPGATEGLRRWEDVEGMSFYVRVALA